jgi:hypothetical protein
MSRQSFVAAPVRVRGQHYGYDQTVEGKYHFERYLGDTTGQALLTAYKAVTRDLQDIIKEALKLKKEIRAHGSEWSLSTVGLAEHRLINTKLLRLLRFTIPASLTAPAYAGDASTLRFVECGESMFALHQTLVREGLSLKASGSNDGQTLAGAMSTGTHGGAFNVGAIPDFVVGLHLVVGPNKHVYLQRQSAPVMKKTFADHLGAEFIEDDDMFNAARVSFGSFGIIQGIMIEARPLFVLHSTRFWHPFNDAIRTAATTLDFSGIDLSLSTLPADAPKDRPYHFQLFFNPNEKPSKKRVSVLMMFEDDWANWKDTYQTPAWDQGEPGPGASALDLIGALFDALPGAANPLVGDLNKQMDLRLKPHYTVGTLGDLFRGEKTRGKLQVTGTALPMDRWSEAIDITMKTYRTFGTVLPVIISSRFVKGSDALLAFNKYEHTCTIELDTIGTPKASAFLRKVRENLNAADIPFTTHWGKLDTFMTPARLRAAYGDALATWKTCRASLLENDAVATAFTNAFMRKFELG